MSFRLRRAAALVAGAAIVLVPPAGAALHGEVFFGTECYGRQASATTKRLLPDGAGVHLFREPATEGVDD